MIDNLQPGCTDNLKLVGTDENEALKNVPGRWLWCVTPSRECLTRKEGGWVNSECAQEPGCPQNQHSGHAARQGLVGYTWKRFPVCVGELWNRSPRKTLEFPCWQMFKFWLEKAQSSWPLLCREPSFTRRLDWRPPGIPSISFYVKVWRGVCSSGRAGRFEALFRGQLLSCNPKIQFLLCSHKSRELSAGPNRWPLSPKVRQHGCP